MNIFLTFAFLFSIGAMFGWVLEVFFRRYFSLGKWINPGFCTGPYIPLYGVGLMVLYALSLLEESINIQNIVLKRAVLFILMAIFMTLIEYIAGVLLLKIYKIRLWDYSNRWGNVQGLICPLFSLFWSILGAAYYFFVNPKIEELVQWLSQNLAFSFFIGLFYGIFILDLIKSAELISKFREFADEKGIVIKVEEAKAHISEAKDKLDKKIPFLYHFNHEGTILEQIKEAKEAFEERKIKTN